MDIIENDGYYRLLQMYKGLISVEALEAEALKQGSSPGAHSILYGIGNWHSYNGRRDESAQGVSANTGDRSVDQLWLILRPKLIQSGWLARAIEVGLLPRTVSC